MQNMQLKYSFEDSQDTNSIDNENKSTNKAKLDGTQISDNQSQEAQIGNKRKQKITRKTSLQLQALEKFFKTYKQPWSQDIVLKLSNETGLAVNQVYKWGWDQRNKMYKRLKTELLNKKQFDQVDTSIQNNRLSIRTHTDEWGGYSKPNWMIFQNGQTITNEKQQQLVKQDQHQMPTLDLQEDESLCKLVGIDIEKRLKEILSNDKQITKQVKKQENLNLFNQKFLEMPPIQQQICSQSEILDQESKQSIRINEITNIQCSEEIIPTHQHIETSIDKVGESFRKKMKKFYQRNSNLARHITKQKSALCKENSPLSIDSSLFNVRGDSMKINFQNQYSYQHTPPSTFSIAVEDQNMLPFVNK